MKAVLGNYSRRRRDRMQIVADVLGVTIGGCLKTHLMYKANLSFDQLNEYLPFLLERRLVGVIILNGKKLYKTTSRGTSFLHNYAKIKDLLKAEGKHEEENNSLVYTKDGNCYKTKE